MTEHPPAPASPSPGDGLEADRRPSGHPGEISLQEVTALVDRASGADTAAIEALEAVVANLRRARDARTQLAATVRPELLRQVLIARASSWRLEQSGNAGQPDLDVGEPPVWPEGRA